MSEPLVSVILPVRNGGRYLSSAVESLGRQEWRNFELVVVDDGSTDGALEQCGEFLKVLPAVQVVRHSESRGIVAALNAGVSAARGDYLARMDADDVCEPDRLGRQWAVLNGAGLDLVWCRAMIIDAGNRCLGLTRWDSTLGDPEFVRTLLYETNCVVHPGVMMRKGLVTGAGGYRDRMRAAEDYDLWLRAVAAGSRLAMMPDVLLRYRRHTGSATAQGVVRVAMWAEVARTLASAPRELDIESAILNRADRCEDEGTNAMLEVLSGSALLDVVGDLRRQGRWPELVMALRQAKRRPFKHGPHWWLNAPGAMWIWCALGLIRESLRAAERRVFRYMRVDADMACAVMRGASV